MKRYQPTVGAGRGRRLWATVLGWALVLGIGPGAATCPGTAPPATLPLPATADPPKEREIRALVSAGGGGDLDGSSFAGGAVRGAFAPKAGMLVGVELGVGARANASASGVAGETVVSSRLMVGYGFWLWGRVLSLSGEAGITPGLHSEHGGFVGPDATLAMTVGGRRWWSLTASYRLTYMIPSRDDDHWSPALYHLAALSVVVPRRARYGFYAQTGMLYGHPFPPGGHRFGLVGVVGFRFSYGH